MRERASGERESARRERARGERDHPSQYLVHLSPYLKARACGSASAPIRPSHCPSPSSDTPAHIRVIIRVSLPSRLSESQVGVHSGPAYFGVVGVKCPKYTILGDTVNIGIILLYYIIL